MKFCVFPLNEKSLFIFRVVLCILSWTSILLMVIPSIISFNFYIFCYYTFQTNLWVLLWITIAVIYSKREKKPFILSSVVRGAITVYITITFLVFVTLLQLFYFPTDPLWVTSNILAHYVVPIMFVFDWWMTEREVKYESKYALYWLSYPLIYLAYSLVQGLLTGFYPYYFIDLGVLGPFIAISATTLALLFYLMGRLYIFLNGKLYKKQNLKS